MTYGATSVRTSVPSWAVMFLCPRSLSSPPQTNERTRRQAHPCSHPGQQPLIQYRKWLRSRHMNLLPLKVKVDSFHRCKFSSFGALNRLFQMRHPQNALQVPGPFPIPRSQGLGRAVPYAQSASPSNFHPSRCYRQPLRACLVRPFGRLAGCFQCRLNTLPPSSPCSCRDAAFIS